MRRKRCRGRGFAAGSPVDRLQVGGVPGKPDAQRRQAATGALCDGGGVSMTRWLAVLSVVALSAGALQARADVLPTEGDGVPCRDGPGPICTERSVAKCVEWRGEEFKIAGTSVSAAYTITCARWETVTTTTYYKA